MVDFTCVMSALLFEASNIFFIVFFIRLRQAGVFNHGSSSHGELDSDDIKDQWDFRNEFHNMFLAGGLLNALAWLCLTLPLLQLSWILSRRGNKNIGRHVAIGLLAVVSSLTEWMSRLLWMGSNLAAGFLSQNFNLDQWRNSNSAGADDGIGWRTLEVKHVMDNGLILFVDSFEWLSLSLILTLVYLSVRDWRKTCDNSAFTKCWNGFGLFLALLCLLEFSAELLRFQGLLVFRPLALGYTILLRLVFLPLWILMLGCQMPRALAQLTLLESRPHPQAPTPPPPIRRGSSAMDSSVASGSVANSSTISNGDIAMTDIKPEEHDQTPPMASSNNTPNNSHGLDSDEKKEDTPSTNPFTIGSESDDDVFNANDDDIFNAYDDLREKQMQRNIEWIDERSEI